MNFWQSFIPSPILFDFGFLTIRWYGFFFAASFVAGYFVGLKLWQKSGGQIKDFDKLFFWTLVWGIVGARVLDVFIFEWEYFRNNLVDLFKIWEGGMSIHGGLIAGAIILWYFSKKFSVKYLILLDILAPAVAIGQAIGRWGNYFNQELFGKPTDLPWGIYIESARRPVEYVQAELFQPVFLYESLALVIIFFVLWWLYKKNKPAGYVVGSYLLLASVLRFSLEFIRVDQQLLIYGVRSGLVIATVFFAVGGYLLFKIKQPTSSLEQSN